MKKRRLKSLDDLRRYLAHVLNEYENGACDEVKVRAVSYACNIMASIVKDGDLEQRVKVLEEQNENKER